VSAAAGTAVLVIGERGPVSWWSGRAAAVPAVELPLGPGITGRVDPAVPHRLLSWTVEAQAAPEPLGAALDDRELADLVRVLRARGSAVYALECPELSEPWRARALVVAVDRWTMRPVHHGALLVDRAVAAHDTGEPTAAGRSFRHAGYAFDQFAEHCLDGRLSAPAVELLRRAVPRAAAHGVTVPGLREALDEAEVIDPLALLDAVRRWSLDVDLPGAVGLAATLGGEYGADRRASEAAVTELEPVPLDPTVLPPRILAWYGARTPELRVEHHPATALVHLSASLLPGVDPFCREVTDLLAYAADRETGALLAVTAVAVASGRVVAELPSAGHDPATLHFGLFAADVAPSALRADPLGRGLVDIDRAMIDAWNQHRTAMATLASVRAGAGEAELTEAGLRCEEHLLLAESATLDARDFATGLLDALGHRDAEHTADGRPAGPDGPRGLLRARLAAIAEYLALLRRPEVAAVPLTLTDLVPPDEQEIDRDDIDGDAIGGGGTV